MSPLQMQTQGISPYFIGLETRWSGFGMNGTRTDITCELHIINDLLYLPGTDILVCRSSEPDWKAKEIKTIPAMNKFSPW